ncbi:MAG: HK97 family phage prohead protease [Rhodobacteraceae bacterium]|jgi:hypothetical protein|nr:HK97 family phage prohead protease [Paracoccaceae bacterium]
MEHAAHFGELELRARRGKPRRLRGRFPYRKRAVLSDGGKNGRPQKEVIASGAFAYRINDPQAEIHLLLGHDYGQPLASRLAGSLDIRDTPDAVVFEAEISDALLQAPYVQNFLAGLAAGLVVGISPGFRLPPPRTVPDAETFEDEDPAEGTARIRTIHQALLYELSAVTVPAYKEALIEADESVLEDILTDAQLDALKNADTADDIKAVLAALTPAQAAALQVALSESRPEARSVTPGGLIVPERSALARAVNRWRL